MVRGAICWMKHDARIPVRAMLAHSGQEYSDKYRRYRKGSVHDINKIRARRTGTRTKTRMLVFLRLCFIFSFSFDFFC